MIGTITRLNTDRGFGFIETEESCDVFFHAKDLVGLVFDASLKGQRVEFAIEEASKGPRARNVKQSGGQ